MHDCFGKPLKPFDRVRAATKEELEARNPPDRSGVETLSSPEKVIAGGNPAGTMCNVHLVDRVTWPAVLPRPDGAGGVALFSFEGSWGYATAHKLVRLD